MDAALVSRLRALPMALAIKTWASMEEAAKVNGEEVAVSRELCCADLFYLLVRACGRVDMIHPWVYARVREVEAAPDGYLDLWAREHYKTSILTFGLTIQDILKDPEITFGIFSHTRPIAKAFLRQIMRELESNEFLHLLFPDILWGKDTKASPKWSEDDGLIVRRKSNPNEATVEAWGLVDGQPVSKHFRVLLYDDIVVAGSVTNPEMIEKTMTALEQSYSLGVAAGGARRFAGTRWHFNDAYSTIIKRGSAKPREHPGKVGGTEDGASVFWPEEVHAGKRRDMGPYTYACQILLNPKADALQGFKREWLRHYRSIRIDAMTVYILVDAASSKKKASAYTSMMAVGLSGDQNYYVLDMIRDRLALPERANRLFAWHRKWKPIQTRYERYGMMADIEHIKDRQDRESYHFNIVEVAGKSSKEDRIKRLLPIYEQGRMWMMESLHVTDWEKVTRDLVHDFIEDEYMAFPNGAHDDMLDSLARIAEPDLPLIWPREGPEYDYSRSSAVGMAI